MQVIDKYLLEMGYFTDEELFEPGDKLQIKIPYIAEGKQINLCPFIVPYYSKSYLAVGLKSLSCLDLQEKTLIGRCMT